MHIEYFNYFYQVAKVKSISKVAKQIHISQSALSQQIQKLEDSMGYKLLERSNKGVTVTEMGEIVLKYSENIINIYDKMLSELEHGNEDTHTVHMEACPSISNYALPCSLYIIKEKFPSHKYEVITNISTKIKDNITNDIADLGFVYKKNDAPNLNYHRVGTNKFVLASSYYYNIPKEITVDEMIEYPMISMIVQDEVKDEIGALLNKSNYSYDDMNILFQLDSIESVKSSLHRKHGVAFLPYISIKEELYNKHFKIINIKDFEININVFMVSKKESHPSKSVEEFSRTFKEIGEKSFC